MNTKKLIIFFIVILFSTAVKSQLDAPNNLTVEYQLENYYNDFLARKIGTSRTLTYENIDGDPYLYKDFIKGTINFEKDKNIVGKLRYNMHTDEVEFTYHDNTLILIYEDSFSGIQLGDYYLVQLKNPHDNKQSKPGYFICLVKGSYELLCKKSVKLVELEKSQAYKDSKPARFEENPEKYFLKQSNKNLYEIKSINRLKKYSPELSKLIDEYKVENKLKMNQESLTNFFNWLNSKKY